MKDHPLSQNFTAGQERNRNASRYVAFFFQPTVKFYAVAHVMAKKAGPKPVIPSYFLPTVHRALQQAGSQQSLADELGVSEGVIRHYLKGKGVPKLDIWDALLRYIEGADPKRSLPQWSPPVTVQPTIKLLGRIRSGLVRLRRPRASGSLPVDPVLFERSPRWKLTEGDVYALQVSGRAMPPFPNGSFVAVRVPLKGAKIPMGTPCIFETGKRFTFKQLGRSSDGRLMGYPYNITKLRAVIFDKAKFGIKYVVIGTIDLDQDAPISDDGAEAA